MINKIIMPDIASVASYIHSLAPLTLLTCSAALYFATLALFTGWLTHFAHSLMGQLKFMNMCLRWKRDWREYLRLLSSVEKRPMVVPLMTISLHFIGRVKKPICPHLNYICSFIIFSWYSPTRHPPTKALKSLNNYFFSISLTLM